MSEEVKTYDYAKQTHKEASSQWWAEKKKEDLHRSVIPYIEQLREKQSHRRERSLFHARLYENENLLGFSAGKYGEPTSEDAKSHGNRLTLNVVKSCTDTLVSKLGTSKPKPAAMTEKANWARGERAKLLTDYLEGAFQTSDFWKAQRLMLRDGCVLGTGVLKYYSVDGKIGVDRVICEEITVDEVEAMYGMPRQLHQHKYVPRKHLESLFPDSKDMIAIVGKTSEIDPYLDSDVVIVYESWKLESTPGKGDGVHCITIENATLFHETWDIPRFPFSFYRYTDRLLGFFGKSLTEELSGLQLEINKTLRAIAKAHNLMATPQVWLEASSKVDEDDITNEIGGVHYYQGTLPAFFTPTAMNPETYNYLERLYQKAFEITGVSQLSAQGQRPSGVNAAVAMRTLQDIESDRFKWTAQKFEEVAIDGAEIIVMLNEKALKDKKDVKVTFDSSKGLKHLSWSEVRMELSEYKIRLFPQSLLPSSPTGKLQTVQELIAQGFLDREEGQSLLDFPDFKAVTSLKVSSREIVMMMIGKMIDEGKYFAPIPQMNLETAKDLAQASHLRALLDGVPEDRSDLIVTFMQDVDALIELRDEAIRAQEEAIRAQAEAQAMATGLRGPSAAQMGQGALPMPMASQIDPNQQIGA